MKNLILTIGLFASLSTYSSSVYEHIVDGTPAKEIFDHLESALKDSYQINGAYVYERWAVGGGAKCTRTRLNQPVEGAVEGESEIYRCQIWFNKFGVKSDVSTGTYNPRMNPFN